MKAGWTGSLIFRRLKDLTSTAVNCLLTPPGKTLREFMGCVALIQRALRSNNGLILGTQSMKLHCHALPVLRGPFLRSTVMWRALTQRLRVAGNARGD